MDWLEKKDIVSAFLKKYRWAAIVLLAGLLLMAIPEKGKEPEYTVAEKTDIEKYDLQQQLESILSKLEGAGKVKVLLTLESGEETYYQTDEDSSMQLDSTQRRIETVIISNPDRSQQGLVKRTDPPRYRGAVILCQGGDHASVRLAVVDAVGTATGLTSDKISVLKMK